MHIGIGEADIFPIVGAGSVSLDLFDRLVTAVYDAALDASKWDAAMEMFAAEFSPAHDPNACLMWEHPTTHDVRFVGTANIEPVARSLYAAGMAITNPLTQSLERIQVGEVLDTDQLVSREALKQSFFYENFLRHWDLERFIGALVDEWAGERLVFFIGGNAGWDIQPGLRMVKVLVPHIQRAARISLRLGEVDLINAASTAALDRAPSGIMILRSDFDVVGVNEPAMALVEAGVIQLRDGRAVFPDPRTDAELRWLREAPANTTIAIRGRAGSDHTLMLAMRLPAEVRPVPRGVLEGATIMLLTGSAHAAPLVAPDWARAWWGLTETETLIADAVGRGRPVSQIALDRGISENAVRFHLKAIFKKTEVESQAQLAAVLARAPRVSHLVAAGGR
jgi:DNA-binding CsgD family transcriptional regulator